MKKTAETETARHVRNLLELDMDASRTDIPLTEARADTLYEAQKQARIELAYQPADTLADAALKMGRLCAHLRDYLNAKDEDAVWAYRLAEGIHDDLEALTCHYAAVIEHRDPLKEYAA